MMGLMNVRSNHNKTIFFQSLTNDDHNQSIVLQQSTSANLIIWKCYYCQEFKAETVRAAMTHMRYRHRLCLENFDQDVVSIV